MARLRYTVISSPVTTAGLPFDSGIDAILYRTPQAAAQYGYEVVSVVDLDTLERYCHPEAPDAERKAANQHNFEIAERLSIHYAGERDRLRQIIGLVPAETPQRTVAELEAEVAHMRAIVDAACTWTASLCHPDKQGAIVEAVINYQQHGPHVTDTPQPDRQALATTPNLCPTCASSKSADNSSIGPYSRFRRCRFRCTSCGYHWVETDDGEVLVPQLRPGDIGILRQNVSPGFPETTFHCASCGHGHDRGPIDGNNDDVYRCLRCGITGPAAWSIDAVYASQSQ